MVTAIEVYSPTNKLTRDARHQYRRKRRAYRYAGANVIEIDLIRRGGHLVDVPRDRLIAAVNPGPYKAVVRRAAHEDVPVTAEYYPLALRERLPWIKVPLRLGDPDVLLDLQQPVDAAYGLGRYGHRVDYGCELQPPLSPDDAAWAVGRVAAAGGGGGGAA